VTPDALHTQTRHVEAMNELGADWILTLKDNQPGLYALADAHLRHDEPVPHATALTGHGRHEVRTIRVTRCVRRRSRHGCPGRTAHAHQALLTPRPRQ